MHFAHLPTPHYVRFCLLLASNTVNCRTGCPRYRPCQWLASHPASYLTRVSSSPSSSPARSPNHATNKRPAGTPIDTRLSGARSPAQLPYLIHPPSLTQSKLQAQRAPGRGVAETGTVQHGAAQRRQPKGKAEMAKKGPRVSTVTIWRRSQ